jgi:peptidoglycan/LPS O-acetylase OafA/YrhL
MTLNASARERDNNFDLLRLAAAVLVLVSHSFVVIGAAEPSIGNWPLGAFGVEIFFAISGFLIAASWLSQPRPRAFAVKRGLRILPALGVTVVACAFVLGPIVTSESVADYFGGLVPVGYVVDNVVSTATGGLVRDVAHDLPGVFTSNPTESVNLSLWTLPIEVRAYLLVALLGVLGLLGRGLPIVALGFFALSVAPESITSTPGTGSGVEFLRGADGETAHLVALFAVAALAYVWRARIALRLDLAAGSLAGLVLSLGTPLERVGLLLAIPYLTLFVAYRSWPALRRLTRHGDVSYGLYLWAFPVEQTIVHLWGAGRPGWLVVTLIALPVTYLLALASWHGVEKRALRLKTTLAEPAGVHRGLSRRRAPEAKPAPIRT